MIKSVAVAIAISLLASNAAAVELIPLKQGWGGFVNLGVGGTEVKSNMVATMLGGKIDVGDYVALAGSRTCWFTFHTEKEMRTRKDCFQSRPDSQFEATVLGAQRVEMHQVRNVIVTNTLSISLACQARYDLLGARYFLIACRRAAGENSLSCWKIGNADRVMRAFKCKAD